MRDRLIELIKSAKAREQVDVLFGDIDDVIDMPSGDEYLANYLLANGVTVQEWISVKDRLPEKHDKYLVRVPSKLVGCEHCIWLIGYNPHFGFYDADPEWGDIPVDDVTHWMPLPNPPKGE